MSHLIDTSWINDLLELFGQEVLGAHKFSQLFDGRALELLRRDARELLHQGPVLEVARGAMVQHGLQLLHVSCRKQNTHAFTGLLELGLP